MMTPPELAASLCRRKASLAGEYKAGPSVSASASMGEAGKRERDRELELELDAMEDERESAGREVAGEMALASVSALALEAGSEAYRARGEVMCGAEYEVETYEVCEGREGYEGCEGCEGYERVALASRACV